MYQKQRKRKKLDTYIPAAELFRIYQEEKDRGFCQEKKRLPIYPMRQ